MSQKDCRGQQCIDVKFKQKLGKEKVTNLGIWLHTGTHIPKTSSIIVRGLDPSGSPVEKDQTITLVENGSSTSRWFFAEVDQFQTWFKGKGDLDVTLRFECAKCDFGKESKYHPFIVLHVQQRVESSRNRRNAEDCNTKDHCCLRSLNVSFASLGWSFILSPKSFDAKICKGVCTKNIWTHEHTQIVSKMRGHYKACCNPIEYAPVEILYVDEDSKNLIQTTVNNIKVVKCSCT